MKTNSYNVASLLECGLMELQLFLEVQWHVEPIEKVFSSYFHVHCHCNLLQLAYVQAADHTAYIKHARTYNIKIIVEIFHYFPKRTERLKETQFAVNPS